MMSRGNARQDIFCSDDDRHLFLELLDELSERFNIEVHAYVLMGNHYHLLLKTQDANLSKSMQWFGTTYTRKFNLLNSRDGHLFRGRFKSIIVENDAYLLCLSCYIHCNPLRAGIVSRLADYKWSSYRHYAYGKKPPAWLNTKDILDELSGEDIHKAYRIKVQQYSDERNSVWEDVKYGLIYGSQYFVDSIKSSFLNDNKNNELPQHNQLFMGMDPMLLFKKAATVLDFDLESSRGRYIVNSKEKEKRDMLIYLLWKTGRMSNQNIGSLFGITYSAVSKIVSAFSAKIQKDKELKNQYNRMNSQFKV